MERRAHAFARGDAQAMLAFGQLQTDGIALDAKWVYFTNNYGGGTVVKIPK